MSDGTRDPVGDDAAMADVLARWDWAATPVGDPSTWPLALRTVVRLMLTSRFPMWAGWGPELMFFYNDAYRRDTLGIKHPWALCRPAHEVWAEIWDDIGPRIGKVLTSGEATWDEALLLFLERSGYREETYHTFSYSPIANDDGEHIAGMLCVVTEETDRVIGDRRMATLRDLAADLAGRHAETEVLATAERRLAANAKDLPFTLVYLHDEGTARLAAVTGLTREHRAAPPVIPRGASDTWSIGEVLSGASTIVVDDLADRFGSLPSGAWDESPQRAAIVPLTQRGQADPVGALVVGLNPYRPADLGYLAFLELVADQITAGIAGARSYEAERRRAESLAELDRAKTEFFSNVSHEFRTPLTLIAGPVEDSLHDDLDPLTPVHRERLETVRRNTGRLRRLVNNMLDFARIEAGRGTAERVATNLAEVTRDLAASFAPAIERAGLQLEVDCPLLPRLVYVDRDMWEKIVLNLLSNALKFTLDGEIIVSLRGTDSGPELTVTDTGVGIPAEQIPQLFDRFHRVAGGRARSHEGTGIGLALVQQLVQLHEGVVSATSEEGRGTTFTVRLPYGESATGTNPQFESSLAAYLDEALQWTTESVVLEADSESRRDEGTVLVVDDNPDLREYVARLLQPYWRVLMAADGQDALDVLAETTPDLVLTDVMMPNVDGFALLHALRSDPLTATIPVILLSARAGEESTIEGLEAGADDYLVKPFSSLELLARVRSALLLGRLRNREAIWRTALVQSLDEGIMIADTNGTVLEINAAVDRLLGLEPAGAPYKPPHPFWPDEGDHPEDFAAVQAAFAEALTSGEFHGQLQFRHLAGHLVPFDVSVASIFDGDERMFVATIRDLTDDLRAAERQVALTSFAAKLSKSSDVRSVLDAGLVELCSAFGSRRAVATMWDAGGDPVVVSHPTGSTWNDLAADVQTAVTDVAAAGRGPVVVGGAGAPTGIALAAGTTQHPIGLWIEMSSSRPLTADELSLAAVVGSHLGQAIGRAQLFEDQRQIATAMQRSILGPADLLPDVAVRYAPAELPLQVGGDWYDVIELGDGRIGLVVGDCVGHGLDAATVMGQLRSACRALVLHLERPGDVLDALDSFAGRIEGAGCTTVLCAVVDGDVVHYSSAGHLPALLVHADGRHQFLDDGRSVPLATLAATPRPQATVEIELGSTLLLYTDGLIERRDEIIDAGFARLAQTIIEHRDLTGEALIDRMMGELLPGGGHADDVAVVAYTHPAASRAFVATVRAEASELAPLRHSLGAWLSAIGADEQSVTDLLIAVGEACTNAIEHAYQLSPERTVSVSARLSAATVSVEVVDDGAWQPPAASPGDRGRGLPIMRGLMDELVILKEDSGTTVRMAKKVTLVR
jgi:PAS domain S-box-containing protein